MWQPDLGDESMVEMGGEDPRKAILEMQPHEFVSNHLLEPVPYLFKNRMVDWVGWKTRLAAALGTDPKEVVMIGSAATGFSLNPAKGFSSFREDSDVDVAIISTHHFDLAWRYLRRSRPSWLSLPKETRNALQSHRKHFIFHGTIATDRILAFLPFAKQWQEALDKLSNDGPVDGREVKLRIYRDFEALRSYHAQGVEQLRDALLEAKEEQTPIPTEEDLS